jgi:hypothetical protein
MAFLPTNTVLGTTDEFKNVSFIITYETTTLGTAGIGGLVGTPTVVATQTVTVTALDSNNTITTAGNTITGYYSESFQNAIEYRTPDDKFVDVQKFKQIDKTNLSEMIYYKADPSKTRTYRYLARASGGDTQIYTVIVKNNWNTGRNEMLSYINPPTQYKLHTVTWINMNNKPIVWVNNLNQPINWINKL